MCVEWLKLKHSIEVPSCSSDSKHEPEAPVASASRLTSANRDLFGNPIELPQPKLRPIANGPAPAIATHQPKLAPSPAPVDTPLVRAVTEADVASFKLFGIEACINSDKLGPVWIVPEYTNESRHELKIEHAMVLAAVTSVFANAQVVAIRKPDIRLSEKSTQA